MPTKWVRFYYKKPLNISLIFYKNIPKHESISLAESKLSGICNAKKYLKINKTKYIIAAKSLKMCTVFLSWFSFVQWHV